MESLKTQSFRNTPKARRIFLRGFSLRVFHFAAYPKPKTRRFPLRHFDQTLKYFNQTQRFSNSEFPFCTTLKTADSEMKPSEFSLRPFDQTPRFSISEFSVWGIAQKSKPLSWKNSEFDQNTLRLVYIDKTILIKVSCYLGRVLIT